MYIWYTRNANNTDDFGDPECESNEGIRERHDRGENREPRHVVEIRYLREDYLNKSKHEHVEVISVRARRFVPFFVVAVWFLNCPAGS